MATLQEILAEARRARAAAIDKGEGPPSEEDAEAIGKRNTEEARKVIREVRPTPESGAEAVGSQLRYATSTVMDPVRAGAKTVTGGDISSQKFRNNLALERAKTARARDMLENIGAGSAPEVGKLAANTGMFTAATPAAAVATPGASMATGAAMSMGQQAFEKYEETGGLPTAGESTKAGITGAAVTGGALALGAATNYGISKILQKGKQLPEQLIKHIERTHAAVTKAEKKMVESKVMISNDAARRMLEGIYRRFDKLGIAQTSPAREAVNKHFASRVAQGDDISLLELNNIRRHIRDTRAGSEYGGIKLATDEMNKRFNGYFYGKSGQGAIVSGDPKLGIAAWNSLNRNHIQEEKLNVLLNITDRAEQLTLTNGWSMTRAMQTEANKYINTNVRLKGKALRMFSPEEQELIRMLSKGNSVGNVLNTLDARMGHGIFSVGFGLVSLPAKSYANTAARNQMQMVVDNIVHGSPVKQGMMSPLLGIPAGMEYNAAETQMPPTPMPIGAKLPNLGPPPGAPQIPQSAAPSVGNLVQPSRKAMGELTGSRNQSGAPSFPEVPGLSGRKQKVP